MLVPSAGAEFQSNVIPFRLRPGGGELARVLDCLQNLEQERFRAG